MEQPEQRGPSGSQEWLNERWEESLAEVLESMTGERPSSEWVAIPEPPREAETLWWEQAFNLWPQPAAWVGLPPDTWGELGSRTLRAAGVEDASESDSRSTCLELLGQAFSGLARCLSVSRAQEVACVGGGECAEAPEDSEVRYLVLRYPDRPLPPIRIAFLPSLWGTLDETAEGCDASAAPDPAPASVSTTLDLLLDMKLAVSVSFGRIYMPLQDVLKLSAGSVVELDRAINDPVELIVNNSVVAFGEVIVVEGNYGVRIRQIVSREKRLWSNYNLQELN